MVLQTPKVPQPIEEVLDEKDRTEIHRMITELRHTYLERHTEALADYNQSMREANRKLHEVTRLEKHIQRIEAFCIKNNIPLTNVLEEK